VIQALQVEQTGNFSGALSDGHASEGLDDFFIVIA
jgi:hypothetical protein